MSSAVGSQVAGTISPEEVVQRQFEAYNARDAEAWSATYADDAQQFEHPDKLLASGRDQIRERIKPRFKETNLHAQLINRIVMRSLVIDHERITRSFPEGPGTVELVAIYEIANGRIARAWFKSGERVLSGVRGESAPA